MELNKRERLKLLNELNSSLSILQNAVKREKLKLTIRINEIVNILGFGDNKAVDNGGVPPAPIDTDPNQDGDNRRLTRGQRQKNNVAAVELLKRIQSGEITEVTGAMKQTLKGYSGNGGNLVNDDGLQGSIYEYYTPKPIAGAMWDVLKEYGFNGGKVLDPSSGTGIFGQTAPTNVLLDAVELDSTSGSINQIINPNNVVKIAPFESVASRTPDEIYDAVITNVPFGSAADRGANAALDPKYSGKSLEYYFILRALDKLRHGGLAAFITPHRCMSSDNGMQTDLRYYASLKAEFLGAWRLPNSVFSNAHADTITDIIFLRKHSADNTKKIKELLKENPQALRDANVLWDSFLKGDYFKEDGKRFVLGEFVAKDPNKIRDVDRVINGASMTDIAKMITKFPDSRIDWAALDLIPTDPILYNEGDTVSQNGVTYVFKDGELVEQSSIKSDTEMMDIASKVTLASIAVNNKVTLEQADKFYMDAMRRSAYDTIPDWLLKTISSVSRLAADAAESKAMYSGLLAGFAVAEVLEYHAASEPFDYMSEYQAVTDAIKANISYVNAMNGGLSTSIKETVRLMKSFYNPKSGEFSIRWQGKSQSLSDLEVDTASLSSYQRYERLKYGRNIDGVANFIDIDKLKSTMGDGFDPYTSDDWCISPDGTGAIHKDDYYVGGYADFLRVIATQIDNATDEKIKEKLLRQYAAADSLIPRIDVKNLNYDMRSPFISHEDKLDFLQRYVDPRFVLLTDSDGKQLFALAKASAKDENDYIKTRFAKYLNGATARTGTQQKTKDKDPEMEEYRKKALDRLVNMAENDFGVWAKANNDLMRQIDLKANAVENLHFKPAYNGDALIINGIRAEFQGRLHDYQNNGVRQYSRNFGGILAFDVGLGKTFTALAAVQYVHSIGVKNKTFFVLPSSVLSNWYKEAKTMYSDDVMAQCLFVGLRLDVTKIDESGNAMMGYDSSKVDEDLNRILENKHKKIYMSLDSFQKIPLKGETIDSYTEYMMTVDSAFTLSKKQSDAVRNDAKASKITATGTKSAGVPYFEDMGCDSLVGDEFHVYKNSKETTDFKGGKFLSLADASLRGLDAQIKAWYIRDMSPHSDGVLGLSATPVTNSPLEIYNMISLAVGEDRIAAAMMGVKGADAFMQAVCDMTTREEMNILGEFTNVEVFNGLKNLSLVRELLSSVANIKTAEEVNLKIPEKEVLPVNVNLSDETNEKLRSFKAAYAIARKAIDPKKNPQPTKSELEFLDAFSEKYGEPIKLLASPFNLISKMTDLIMDDDLVHKFSKWGVSSSQLELAAKVSDSFNKLGVTEDRTRLTMLSTEDDIVKTKIKKKDKDNDDAEDTVILVVRVKSFVKNGELILDSVDFKTQQKLLKIAEKLGLNLVVSFSPKIAAMLENFKKEEANPIMGAKSKQLIFCDNKGLHNKLKQAIVQECGIPASQVIIINGETAEDAADMQDFQDGFNAMPDSEGGEYRYRVAICNKKAEVGINLQKGTQAIHHLTTGWTPDSIQQRDGRGVRQGNKAEKVKVYMYNANGTFDEYKLILVGKKSDWIGSVLSKGGGEKVSIGGQISNRDYEDLINSIGDPDAIRKARERIEENERLQIIERAKDKQKKALSIIDGQAEYVKKRLTQEMFLEGFVTKALGLYESHQKLSKNAEKQDVSDAFRKRNAAKRDEVAPKLNEMKSLMTGIGGTSRSIADVSDLSAYWKAFVSSSDFTKGVPFSSYIRHKLGAAIITEDSDLYIKWQSEIALAEGMIEQAANEFKSQGSGFDGRLGDLYRDGKAVLVNDKFIVSGTVVIRESDNKAAVLLMRENGDISVNVQPTLSQGTLTANIFEKIYTKDEFVRVMAGNRFVTPLDADYDSALQALAKAQDELVKTGITRSKDRYNTDNKLFYSDILPEVSKYTTQTVKVWYSPNKYVLPSPYFRFILRSDGLKEVSQSIYAEQSKLFEIRGTNYAYEFTMLDNSIEPTPATYDEQSSYANLSARALIDYVRYGDNEVSLNAIAAVTGSYQSAIGSIMMTKIGADIHTLISTQSFDFESEDEVFIYLENFIKAKYPTFNISEILSISRRDSIKEYLITACGYFIDQLKKLWPQPVMTEAETIYAKAEKIAVNGLVSIKDAVGKSVTKDNKDHIKSYSLRYGLKNAGWDKNSVSWTIPLAAYKKLVEDKPFMKDIDVFPPFRLRLN